MNIYLDEEDSLKLGKRSAKRRKRSDLNSRFDRMISRVNTSVTTSSSSGSRSQRRRLLSEGSSSTLSADVVKTPESRNDNVLGDEFSVIKLDTAPTKRKSPKPVPPWLSHTLLSLEEDNPLRLLVLPSMPFQGAYRDPASATVLSNAMADDDNPFAYILPITPKYRLDQLNTDGSESSYLDDIDNSCLQYSDFMANDTALSATVDGIDDPKYMRQSSDDSLGDSINYLPSYSYEVPIVLPASERDLYFGSSSPSGLYDNTARAIFNSSEMLEGKDLDDVTSSELNSDDNYTGINADYAERSTDDEQISLPTKFVSRFLNVKNREKIALDPIYSTSPELSDEASFKTPFPYFASPTEDPSESEFLESRFDDVIRATLENDSGSQDLNLPEYSLSKNTTEDDRSVHLSDIMALDDELRYVFR